MSLVIICKIFFCLYVPVSRTNRACGGKKENRIERFTYCKIETTSSYALEVKKGKPLEQDNCRIVGTINNKRGIIAFYNNYQY